MRLIPPGYEDAAERWGEALSVIAGLIAVIAIVLGVLYAIDSQEFEDRVSGISRAIVGEPVVAADATYRCGDDFMTVELATGFTATVRKSEIVGVYLITGKQGKQVVQLSLRSQDDDHLMSESLAAPEVWSRIVACLD